MNWDRKIRLTIEQLEKSFGRAPLVEEVCTEIGMALDKFLKKYSFYNRYLLKNDD